MDIFGHNKPIRDFFIAMGCMLGGTLIDDLLFGLTSHQEKLIDWPSFTFFFFFISSRNCKLFYRSSDCLQDPSIPKSR